MLCHSSHSLLLSALRQTGEAPFDAARLRRFLEEGRDFSLDAQGERLAGALAYLAHPHALYALGDAGVRLPPAAMRVYPAFYDGTLLHYFCRPHPGVDMRRTVRALLGMGFDPRTPDLWGRTALDVLGDHDAATRQLLLLQPPLCAAE